ncbi:MAG: hypothetical protein HZA34_00040 [Candidatus Pacebacteria bacterium]|nr:hypothetical protein [Candidatus Paceibacterota bacterium]
MLQLTHYQKGSFSFVKNDGGQIVSAVYSGKEIKLGQKVYSNGRIFVPAGTIGIVVEIHEPGDGLTSNIFDVWFEGEPSATLMKTKDLRFE